MDTYTKNVLKIVKNIEKPTGFIGSSPGKISKKKNNAFSMLAGSKFGCPGETKACESCYARRGRHHCGQVQKALSNNWMFMKKLERNNSVSKTCKEILKIIPANAKIFRIHESSDFHSQWVIGVWEEVIKARPNVNFWAYTRSFHLNFTQMTKFPNFMLWASTDQYNLREAKQFVRRFRKSGTKHAYGPWGKGTIIPKNSFICPATNGNMEVSGACEKCILCVVKKRTAKNVVFLKH